MAKKLFNLRGVPDDESAAVRELLSEHDIPFSETNAGILGFGTAAIWVSNPADYTRAKALFDAYQKQRYTDARKQYEIDKQAGQTPTTVDLIKQRPLRFFGFILLILILMYLVLSPFFSF